MYPNKSISPVVATALLLVVAVVAVIGFQTWFQTYSSSILSNIEKNKLPNKIQVEGVFGNDLYLTSSREDTFTLFKIEDLNGNLMCEYDSKNKEYFNNTKLILSLDDDSYNETSVIDKNNNISFDVLGGPILKNNDCVSGECFYFDGIDDSLLSYSLKYGELYASSDYEWSICSWFKSDTNYNSKVILGRGGGTGAFTTFVLYFTSGSLNVRIRGGTVNEIVSGYNNNVWHFACVTWNGNDAYIYVDNNITKKLEVGSESEQNSYFSIGAAASGSNNFIEETVDEVSLYNKPLTQNEVNALYNLRKAVPYEEILTEGVRKINISNCNLIPNQEYNFVGFTDTQTIQQSFTVK